MKVRSVIAASALVPGICLSPAAPTAWAEAPTMNGAYHYADDDGDVGTWVIRTTCTPDCVAHVTTAPGRGFDAQFIDGRYQVTRVVPEGHTCPPYTVGDGGGEFPGGAHPITVFQWWDPVTLAGEVDFVETQAPCGMHDLKDRFTLTKIG